jgi:hypothetical protein
VINSTAGAVGKSSVGGRLMVAVGGPEYPRGVCVGGYVGKAVEVGPAGVSVGISTADSGVGVTEPAFRPRRMPWGFAFIKPETAT